MPVEKEQLQPADETVFKGDCENIRYYKNLCRLEVECAKYNTKEKV